MAKKDLIKRADGSYSPRGLWDNIRANAGSGKKPTKEMLAQEKKIKNQMSHGGKMSSFKASNIQTYADGGPIKPPKFNIAFNPYAYNPNELVGYKGYGNLSGANIEASTLDLLGRQNKVNALKVPLSVSINKLYDPNTINDTIKYGYESTNIASSGIPASVMQSEAQKQLDSAYQPYLSKTPLGFNIETGIAGSGLNPNIKKRTKHEMMLSGGYNPLSGFNAGLNTKSSFALGNDFYRPLKTGDWRVAANIQPFGMRVSQAPGYSEMQDVIQQNLQNTAQTGEFNPNTPGFDGYSGKGYGSGLQVTSGAGLDAEVKLPLGTLIGGAGIKYNRAAGEAERIAPSGYLGYSLSGAEMSKMASKLPKIPMPNLSPLTSFLGRADKGGEENLQIQGGDPYGDFGPKVNASPIDKRWNKNAEDIYVPSTKSGSNVEPIIYDPNDPEGLGENNFKQGGAMNFKSPAAYKAWLAYGHATGEFERTPGNQKVSIGGKAHNVKHAMGGHMYSMGGRAFADGGQLTEFNEGGSHEINPLGGIPQGFAQDGKLNLVEQGETKLNAADYIFSDEIKVSKKTATLYDLPKGDIGKTFADISKKLNRPNSRRENDTIEQVAIQRDLENLMQAQEQQKESEKQAAVAEMQSKYPDLQIVDQAAMADQQAMADEMAMQQQQQMAPPAGMPQEIDPAMMQQMQQQGIMSMGGKMYNMGGHMYGAGGGMMALRGIGAGAYGIGEGMLDTLTFGLTDSLTDKGYEKLSQLGEVDDRQADRLDAVRGFGNTAGAITSAAISGGATTKSAISEGVEGLASGVAALPGTGEKTDKVAQGVGQLGSMYGTFFGGSPDKKVIPEGALEGSKAAAKLMNAPQNPFITKAMNVAGNFMAQGGYLGAPTTGMFTNQFAEGSSLDPITGPKATFNIQGVPVSLTIEEALNNPIILQSFMPEGADADGDGKFDSQDIEMAKAALEEHYASLSNPIDVSTTEVVAEEGDDTDLLEVEKLAQEDEAIMNAAASNGLVKPEGMSDDEWASELRKMLTKMDKKTGLESIEQNPILAGVSALPALYNIGRGLFGKVNQLDVSDYQSRAKISPYEMNVDPQLAAVRSAYGTAMQAAKNAAPGAGSYLATLGNMANMRQQAIRDIYAQKENFDKAQKMEADKFNAQVESNNMTQDLAIQQYNDQALSARQNMLAAGLTQASEIAQGLSSTDLQEKYLQTIAPDYAGNFRYISIADKLNAAAAARRANKGKNS